MSEHWIKKGSITATRHDGSGVRFDHVESDATLTDIDAAIVQLCKLRESLDPIGYMKLVDEKLFPYQQVVSPGFTATEMLRTLHAVSGKPASAAVDAAGRTTLTIGEPIRAREPHEAVKRSPFDVSFEVECRYTPTPELLAAINEGADKMRAHVDEAVATFQLAVNRAAHWLMKAGVEGVSVVQGEGVGRSTVVQLLVGSEWAASVSGAYVMDGDCMVFNVETTWHPPYEGLADK